MNYPMTIQYLEEVLELESLSNVVRLSTKTIDNV